MPLPSHLRTASVVSGGMWTCLEGLGSMRLLHSPSKAKWLMLLRLLLLLWLLDMSMVLLMEWPMGSSMWTLPAIALHMMLLMAVRTCPSSCLPAAAMWDVWLLLIPTSMHAVLASWPMVTAVLITCFHVILSVKCIHRHLVTSTLIKRRWNNVHEVDSCIGTLPVVNQPICLCSRLGRLLLAMLAQVSEGCLQLGRRVRSHYCRVASLFGILQLQVRTLIPAAQPVLASQSLRVSPCNLTRLKGPSF